MRQICFFWFAWTFSWHWHILWNVHVCLFACNSPVTLLSASWILTERNASFSGTWTGLWLCLSKPGTGNITNLYPWQRGFHMWVEVSPIHHHLGKMRMCQRRAVKIQGEKQYPNRYLETLTKRATESQTGVRIHGRKEDGKLTQRKTTVLDGCCCHLLLWANNQHLCFPSQGCVLDPWVFPSDVCEHCLCLTVCRNWSVCGNCGR